MAWSLADGDNKHLAKATIEMKKAARDRIAHNQKSVFHDREKFKYADDEEILRKLMGL